MPGIKIPFPDNNLFSFRGFNIIDKSIGWLINLTSGIYFTKLVGINEGNLFI